MIEEVLRICLVRCMHAAATLEHEAGHLLTPGLAHALLGLDRSMPRDVKHAGLGLVLTVSGGDSNVPCILGSASLAALATYGALAMAQPSPALLRPAPHRCSPTPQSRTSSGSS